MRFIVKISLFCLLFVATYLFFIDKLSKGYVDVYYNKFTKEAGSLILGLSRADQGIVPQVLKEELDSLEFNMPIINFAINLDHSAYGELYLQGVKRKLNPNIKNGLFILSISPGTFTAPIKMNDQDIFEMDKKGIIGKTSNLKHKPNYDYIINNYAHPLYNSFINFTSWSHHFAHKDGWNEIVLANDFDTLKKEDIQLWKNQTIRYYNEKKKYQHISEYRIKSFIKIVEYLKTKGKVFWVRIPADSDMIDFENLYWAKFDKQFDSLSKKHKVPYLNYTLLKNNYKTYDGSHMVSESAKKFTKQLSLDIKEYLKEKH